MTTYMAVVKKLPDNNKYALLKKMLVRFDYYINDFLGYKYQNSVRDYLLEKYGKYLREYKHGKHYKNILRKIRKDSMIIITDKNSYKVIDLRGPLGRVASRGKHA